MTQSDVEVAAVTIEREPRGALVHIPVAAEVVIQLGDRIFRDAGFGGMNGFYDYLRGPSGIVGIRFWPHPSLEFLASLVASEDGIVASASPNPSICLYPCGQQEFHELESCDRDMIENRILRSDDGAYAATFAVDLLSPQEHGSLRILLERSVAVS